MKKYAMEVRTWAAKWDNEKPWLATDGENRVFEVEAENEAGAFDGLERLMLFFGYDTDKESYEIIRAVALPA